MEEEIKKLEKELSDLRELHRGLWDIYGSELCAGDMISKEDAIIREIDRLKASQVIEDPRQIVDD